MRIVIYLREAYPHGMACTKRIHLYAKGFIKCGHTVKIIVPKTTENSKNIDNKNIQGIFEGINYQYANKTTVRSNSFFGRRIQDIYGFFCSLSVLKSYKPDAVLFVGNSNFRAFSLYLLKLFSNWILIREKSEGPYFRKPFLSKMDKLILKFNFSLFDGIIVISETLKEFFKYDLNVKTKYYVNPILIEDKIKNSKRSISNNIVYTGSLLDHKDGILTLVKAFSKVVKCYPDLRLVMTGNLENSADKKNILGEIKRARIESKVKFTGYISEQELSLLTTTAKILVLAKPYNRQNKYNSATKVGEYLITGQPIILSKADTACDFLSDNLDVFMVEPNVDELTEKLKYVIENYGEAIKVGQRGKITALNKFEYTSQIKNLSDFLNSIR